MKKPGASLIYPMRIWVRNLCDSRVNFLYIMFILLFALSHDVLSHLGEVIYPVISSSQVGFFFGSFLGMCSGGGIADVVPKLGCYGSGHSKKSEKGWVRVVCHFPVARTLSQRLLMRSNNTLGRTLQADFIIRERELWKRAWIHPSFSCFEGSQSTMNQLR